MDALRDIVSKCTSANKRGWFFGLGPGNEQAFIKELCETDSDYQTLLGKYRGRVPVPPHVLNATDQSGTRVSSRLLGYLKSKQRVPTYESTLSKVQLKVPITTTFESVPIKTYSSSKIQLPKKSQAQPPKSYEDIRAELMKLPGKNIEIMLKNVFSQNPIDNKSIVYNASKYFTKSSTHTNIPNNYKAYSDSKKFINMCKKVQGACEDFKNPYYFNNSGLEINDNTENIRDIFENAGPYVDRYNNIIKNGTDIKNLLENLEDDLYSNFLKGTVTFQRNPTEYIKNCVKEENVDCTDHNIKYHNENIANLEKICGKDPMFYRIVDTNVGKNYYYNIKALQYKGKCNGYTDSIPKNIPIHIYGDDQRYTEDIHLYWYNTKNYKKERKDAIKRIGKSAKKYKRKVINYTRVPDIIKHMYENDSKHVIILHTFQGIRPGHRFLFYISETVSTSKDPLINSYIIFEKYWGINIAYVYVNNEKNLDVQIINNVLCFRSSNKDMLDFAVKAI